jgi:branched-chain amino acid transport system substrate-binding protein
LSLRQREGLQAFTAVPEGRPSDKGRVIVTMRNRVLLACTTLTLGLMSPAQAQDKDKEILIGHVAGYTGPVTRDATELRDGGKVLIESINAKGGVLGRKVRLIEADDFYKPEETAKLIAAMPAQKVVALLPAVGSANIGYMLKQGTLNNLNLPIIGTVPSNESFRNPVNPNLFHFRAGDRAQLEKIVEQVSIVGMKNIAILARDNPSSTEGIGILKEALKQRGVEPSAVSIYDVSAKSFGPQVKVMQDKRPDAIILLGTQQGIANVTKELKAGGISSMLYAVSYADFKLISQVVGNDQARGFVISQVLPNLNKRTLPLIRAFRDDWAAYQKVKAEPTHYNLEGYIAAKLIVEAIRKSKDASPDGVRKGLQQMREFDLGGYMVDFSSSKHSGSTYVDLSMLSGTGQLIY